MGNPLSRVLVSKRIKPALSMKREEEHKSKRGGRLKYLLLDGVLARVTVRTVDVMDVRAAKGEMDMTSRQMGFLLQSLC